MKTIVAALTLLIATQAIADSVQIRIGTVATFPQGFSCKLNVSWDSGVAGVAEYWCEGTARMPAYDTYTTCNDGDELVLVHDLKRRTTHAFYDAELINFQTGGQWQFDCTTL